MTQNNQLIHVVCEESVNGCDHSLHVATEEGEEAEEEAEEEGGRAKKKGRKSLSKRNR